MNYVNQTKLKFKSNIIKSSNKSILFIIFFVYVKIFIKLSAKYYQENKERLQKKLVKDIKTFLKKKRGKSNIMVVNVSEIYQKMKNKSLFKQMLYYNYKKVF